MSFFGRIKFYLENIGEFYNSFFSTLGQENLHNRLKKGFLNKRKRQLKLNDEI